MSRSKPKSKAEVIGWVCPICKVITGKDTRNINPEKEVGLWTCKHFYKWDVKNQKPVFKKEVI